MRYTPFSRIDALQELRMQAMVREIFAKTSLNKHKRRDEWFLDDYSLNPYQLCEFNCVYCYIRESKYGSSMSSGLVVKVNMPTLLERELRRKARRKEFGFIAPSSATKPWMYIEEKYRVARRCLEVIARYRFPVHCLTKSPLILRDLNLLMDIGKSAVLPPDLRDKLNHEGSSDVLALNPKHQCCQDLRAKGSESQRKARCTW